MPLKDYLATLQPLLTETLFVTSTTLNYEERPPTAGLIKGTFSCRKHVAQDILAAQQPSLGQVLQEITSRLKFP